MPLETPPRIVHKRPGWKFWLVLGVLGLPAALLSKPLFYLLRSAQVNAAHENVTPAGFADDASRLNRTHVEEVIQTAADSADAELQLAELLRRANDERLKVAIAGARHTMGGHTIAADGIQIDMTTFRGMSLSADSATLHVRAGTRWSEVIPFLDSARRSLPVMQSNNSFTVGGSLSADAHGWQHDHAPIASIVRSIRIMTADGVVRRASRDENAELFRATLGGYGLFGIILDAELVTVPNEMYKVRRYRTTAENYENTYARRVRGQSSIGMAYGRLSISRATLLREALLTEFVRDSAATGPLPPLATPELLGVKRAVVRGSEGSQYGKALRWTLEKWLGELPGATRITRNQLLNEPVDFYANTSDSTTDILHEYFVPSGKLAPFVARIRPIITQSRADLINVTVRNVLADSDAFLAYAREPVWGLVLLFTEERSTAGDARMRALTRRLIDAVLAVGGTYYLPYRLHATREQFARAYPMAPAFFALKRKYDPHELFSNAFYTTYAPAK